MNMDNVFYDEFGESHQKPENAEIRWRPSIYGVLTRENGKILMVKPGWIKKFILPGGGLEVGESMAEGLAREFYEETGYRVGISDEVPLYLSEGNFYSKTLGNKFYHALVFIFRVKLLSNERDAHAVNALEKDEIAGMEYLLPKDLNENNCHYAFWPFIKTL